MILHEALKVFKDISGLELYPSEWDRVEKALLQILKQHEKDIRQDVENYYLSEEDYNFKVH